MTEPLTATQVAERLGVDVTTVYAYASRGALTRLPGPGRSSRYHADEVELLARKGRPRSARRKPGAIDVVIGTTVSEIGDGWIRYRGHDLADLVTWCSYEDACELLWTGQVAGHPADALADGPPSPEDAALALAAVDQVASALPRQVHVSGRLAAAAISASPWIPRAKTVDTSVRGGRLLIDALIRALPVVGDHPSPLAGTVAARLWPRISPLAPTTARLRALDTALVLMAEHELATSTLAVRVAASTRAKPAEAVLAGLGAMSGPFHGRAAVRVHQRLAEGLGPVDTSMLAGFGHTVHEHGDPRFAPLLARVLAIASPRRSAVIQAYVQPAAGAPPPNVDAAIGALGFAAAAEPGATEAVFAIARTAGWLAHAFEEADEAPVRFRGRALYRGPR